MAISMAGARVLGKFRFGSGRLDLLNGVDPGGESLRRGELVTSLDQWICICLAYLSAFGFV